jgi:hypothetical protein
LRVILVQAMWCPSSNRKHEGITTGPKSPAFFSVSL